MSELRRRVDQVAKRCSKLKARPDYFNDFGFAPSTVIDVGVHTGTPWLYAAFPDADFKLIDPLIDPAVISKRWSGAIRLEVLPIAVGAKAADMTLRIPMRSGRELRNMTSAGARSEANVAAQNLTGVREVEAKVERLDTLSKEWSGPFGLKVDTEGHELEVIRGAAKTLAKAEFVVLEVSMSDRFEGGYRFSELIAAMGMAGFEPREFLSGFGHRPLISEFLFTPA